MHNNNQKGAKNTDSTSRFHGTINLIIKQSTAAIVCFAIVLGMRNSSAPKLKSYADSLGKALRYNSNWKQDVSEAIKKVKDFKSQETTESPVSPDSKEDMSFQ